MGTLPVRVGGIIDVSSRSRGSLEPVLESGKRASLSEDLTLQPSPWILPSAESLLKSELTMGVNPYLRETRTDCLPENLHLERLRASQA